MIKISEKSKYLTKNIEGFLDILLLHLTLSHFWLNIPVDYRHFGYITKLSGKTRSPSKKPSSIVASALYTRLVSFCEREKSISLFPIGIHLLLKLFLLVGFLFLCIVGCFSLVTRSKRIISDFRSPPCSRIVCVGFESAVFVSSSRCREKIIYVSR